ncbi:MAG: MATE family efflux transporter [Clostridiales bacterium]|nr:MATE family efflux transporter [Clostridiales bacterium]
MKTRNMTEGSPIKLLLAVAFPLMLGNVFQQLYTVVDAQVVGAVEGVSALAALGSSDWFLWLFTGMVQGFAQGFTIPVAQAFGAGDIKALKRNVGNAAVLTLLIGVASGILAILMITPVHNWLNMPEAIRPCSRQYLTVIFAGLPIFMAYNVLGGILRSLGDGKTPLLAMVIASLTNIALDLLFVAVFRMGVTGAAAATVIAQLVSCLFCLGRLRHLPIVHPAKEDFRLDRAVVSRQIWLGIPVGAQNIIIAVGGMFVQSIVNGMGVAFIAGYTASNKLYGVLEIAAVSYGYAVSTYAGQNMGAKKPDRIRSGIHAAVLAGILTAAGIGAAMFLFGHHILASFLSGSEKEVADALKVAVEYLRTMAAFLPILYLLYIYRSALQGMGNTVMPMVSGFVELAMRVGAAILLPGWIGYQGLFIAEVLAWIGADFVLMPSYYAMLGKLRRQWTEDRLQE